MAQVNCSFCGRSKKDVRLMISGIHAHICDKCIEQANVILEEETKNQDSVQTPKLKLNKPKEIKEFIDQDRKSVV